MFNSYFPYSSPTFGYGAPSYSYGRPDREYLHALAEEEAARRQYAEALRAQEEARNRAARARFARQAYEAPHASFLDEDYDDDGVFGREYPPRSRYPSAAAADRHRLAVLERERQREQERIRALEEERELRRQLFEEERRRRLMAEEEQRRMQREAEERRRLERELFRRQPSRSPQSSPLEDILGIRPAQVRDTPLSRRGRTTSPVEKTETTHSVPIQRAASQSSSRQSIPINIRVDTRSPSPSTSKPTKRADAPSSPRPKSPQPPSEREVEAAIKIQTTWRDHHSRRTAMQSITELGAKFAQLKDGFFLPASLDFSTGTNLHEHTTVPTSGVDTERVIEESEVGTDVPKLAYTTTNAPLHAYYEELSRILTKLDGVQSGGDEEVRTKRRELARQVEREAERIERLRAPVWRAWLKKQEESMAVESTDAEPAVVEHEMAEPAVVEQEMAEAAVDGQSTALEENFLSSGSALDPVKVPSSSDVEPVAADEPSNAAVPVVETTETAIDECPMETDIDEKPRVDDTCAPSSSLENTTSSSDSLPPLVLDHNSEDDCEPSTPPQTPSNTDPLALPPSRSMSMKDLELLRPLFCQDWDEQSDFF